MQPAPRHQCLIYSGPPSRHLPALASTMREKLRENYRCLYLNSPAMVAGLRSYLAAAGVDVAQEVTRNSLTLSSDQPHFANGSFDMDRLLKTLENLLKSALRDRYKGLWAVGDMTCTTYNHVSGPNSRTCARRRRRCTSSATASSNFP